MANLITIVKCVLPSFSKVYKLIWNCNCSGLALKVHASYCCRRYNSFDAHLFKCPDIGSIVNPVWRDPMISTVPWDKSYLFPGIFAYRDEIRWTTIWRMNLDFLILAEKF